MRLSYIAISAVIEMTLYQDTRGALEKLDLIPNENGELDISEDIKRRLEDHENLIRKNDDPL